MKRVKEKGFTLIEMTFVILIMLILASLILGGAAYLMNQARGQTVIDQGKQIQIAAENYAGRRKDGKYPAATTDVDLNNQLKSFMGNGSTLFTPPYAGLAPYSVEPVQTTGTTTGTSPAAYISGTDYPKITKAGQVVYFGNTAPGTMAAPTYIIIWTGAEDQNFKYFAVQALDSRGNPLATTGQ